MNIPKSYEALAADLASEKILSKTLLGQKEAYMMLSDERKVERDAALARDAALRESLTDKRDEYNKLGDRYDALQQRLTVAEKRADLLEGLLKSGRSPTYAHCSAVMEALKPAEEGEGS